MPLRIGILEPEEFSEAARAELAAIGEVEVFGGGDSGDFVADKDALFVRLGHSIDAHLLAAAPRLRFLCSPTTAHDHIDEQAAREHGIQVISLRGERAFLNSIRATPEHALGLIIAVLRNYGHAFQHAAGAEPDRTRLRGREVSGSTVGIVGYGRVGRAVSAYLQAMGATIFFRDTDSSIDDPAAHRAQSLDDLLARADLVLLAATHSAENVGMISRRHLEALAGKYFVNVARGELVDEDSLIELIAGDHFAGVGLDVIRGELAAHNNRARLVELSAHHNLIVTPHIAGATVESMHRTEEFIAAALKRCLEQGGNP